MWKKQTIVAIHSSILRGIDCLQIRVILSVYSADKQSLTPSHLMTGLSRIPWSIRISFDVDGACLIFIEEVVKFVMSRLHSVGVSRMRVASVDHIALVSDVGRALLIRLSLLVGNLHLVHRTI